MKGSAIVDLEDATGRRRRMVLRLDRTSVVPPYEQLRAQLTVMVAAGLLEPGTQLPTVRSLAGLLELSPGTVARAYRELETSGYLDTRGRRGSFIADEPPNSEPLEERRRRLAAAADEFTATCQQLGIDSTTAINAVRDRLQPPSRSSGVAHRPDL